MFIKQGKTNVKYLFIVIVLATIVGGGIFAWQYFETIKRERMEDSNIAISSEEEKEQSCLYGNLPEEQYLREYIVKPGDTLIGIAEQELGSSVKVDQIITLNEKSFPGLSLANPFIEIGWTLELPPIFIVKNAFQTEILGFQGLISEYTTTTGELFIVTNEEKAISLDVLETAYTKYLGQTNFNKGDCVQILINERQELIVIAPQDSPYFILGSYSISSNENYNFEIGYPANWDITEDTEINGFRGIAFVHTDLPQQEFFIRAWDKRKTGTQEEILVDSMTSVTDAQHDKTVDTMVINGIRAIKVSWNVQAGSGDPYVPLTSGQFPGAINIIEAVFSKGNFIYFVHYKGVNPESFDQIISTFRFLD